MFTVLVLNDGRNDYLEQTLFTFFEQVRFPDPPYKMLVDDMPEGRDVSFLERLATRYRFDELILNDSNLGLFGTVMKAWSLLPTRTRYIFHLENDFVFPETVDVRQLVTVLDEPSIWNVTLLRQAWYEDERLAGGMIQSKPGWFREAVVQGIPVCLQQRYFGFNPGMRKGHGRQP